MADAEAPSLDGLPAAARVWAPAGGGAYQLRVTTIGLFHTDQPQHCFALGSDRAERTPLRADDGWVLPAGAAGLCTFEAPLALTTVTLPHVLLVDAGLIGALRPQVGALDPLVVNLVKTIATARAATSTLYRQTLAQALAAHLVQLSSPLPAEAPTNTDPRLARALAYLRDHLADDVSLDQLAAAAAMSPFHFARQFKLATGLSPLRYVIQERMRLAAVLLRTTRLPITEIAYRVGYQDTSRFAVQFKRHHGVTPGAARSP